MDENMEVSTAARVEAVAGATPAEATEGTTANTEKKKAAGTKKSTGSSTKKPAAGGTKKPASESAAKDAAPGEKKAASGSTKKSAGSGAKAKKSTSASKRQTVKETLTPPTADETPIIAEEFILPISDAETVKASARLDALAYDSDEQTSRETAEENERFEKFFRDYKALIDGVMADTMSKPEDAPLPTAEDSADTAEKASDAESDGSNPTEEDAPIAEDAPAVEDAPVEENAPAEDGAYVGEGEAEATADGSEDASEGVNVESGEPEATATSEENSEQPTEDATEADEGTEGEADGSQKDIEESSDESEVSADDEDEAAQMTIAFEEDQPEETAEDAPKERRDPDKFDSQHSRFIDTVFEFVELFVFTLVAVMILTTFFFRYSQVEGGSMDMTLADGDRLIISDFLYTPERGDIIVFEDYSTDIREPLVKRVIGVAGDVVEVKIDGSVYVNGELLDEPYVYVTPGKAPTRIHGKWTVEDGELFVMGDHRDVSKDSREFGPISEDSVLGEVKLRFFPFDSFGTP